MTDNTYDIGDLIRSSVTFTNSAGESADPTTITFKFKIDDETVTTYLYLTDAELVKDDTGDFHVDISPTVEGAYYCR